MTSTNIPVSTSLPSRRLFKLLYKFQQMLQKGLWVWGEAIQKLRQKGSYEERIFKTMLHELGRSLISLLHTTITFMYKKDNEDPSWSTSFKTRRTQKTSSAVWKCLKDFYFVVFDRMAKKSVMKNNVGQGTGQRETRPVLNNAQRINHQNKFVPSAVLTRSGRVPVSAAKKSSPRAAVSTSPTRPVNTATPKKSVNLSNSRRNTFHKVNGVNTAGQTAVSAVEGNGVSAVKASASCVWRPKMTNLNNVSKDNSGSWISKRVDYIDLQGRLNSSSYKSSDEKDGDDTTDDAAAKKIVQKPASKNEQALKNVLDKMMDQEKEATEGVNAASASGTFSDAGPSFVPLGRSFPIDVTNLPHDPLMPDLEDTAEVQSTGIFGNAYDDDDLDTYNYPYVDQAVGAKANFNNMELSTIQEPKKIAQALDDKSWVEAMQEKLLQFKIQKI
ncbi:hypothetical protein Tco_0938697 [Tanacetum coccineum]|uniref:Uncharacterized protein n=1 Tax=Tanacetum coccineum TaxID=301880 RepID=A0ABQ5DIJ7_9ASTR